ncbi:MAG TPA: hypothetical protein VGH97_14395 [Thermoanaerobaculia bacterium]|jgi:hypothetical protein
MHRANRLPALLALLGMGSLTVGAAAALSMSCCSASCESCPVSFCRDANADKAPKAATLAPAAPAPLVRAAAPIASLAPVAIAGIHLLPTGFVRPLRR